MKSYAAILLAVVAGAAVVMAVEEPPKPVDPVACGSKYGHKGSLSKGLSAFKNMMRALTKSEKTITEKQATEMKEEAAEIICNLRANAEISATKMSDLALKYEKDDPRMKEVAKCIHENIRKMSNDFANDLEKLMAGLGPLMDAIAAKNAGNKGKPEAAGEDKKQP